MPCAQNVVFISMISFAATVFTAPITVAVPGSVTVSALGNTSLGGSVTEAVTGVIGKLQGVFGI
ncbi:hypothetical protein GCM10011513_03300 [Franconibacter daqui]|nr:hypothetical protein GCM10011513_03300 [Franconibacter daqui]